MCLQSQTCKALRRETGPRHPVSDEEEPLVDLTAAHHLSSKRTECQQKRINEETQKQTTPPNLVDLPPELLLTILETLRPSTLFIVSRTSKALHHFIFANSSSLGTYFISSRYSILAQCFRLPVSLSLVDPEFHEYLQCEDRQRSIRSINCHEHIPPQDPTRICTCDTCILRWEELNLIIGFAHWQALLDTGRPIFLVQALDTDLLSAHRAVAEKALESKLWYARVLEEHLASIVRSIRRHAQKKWDWYSRFRMEREDEESETDAFLERSGPPSVYFPISRNYYIMLESYFPNREWIKDKKTGKGRWMYVPATEHDLRLRSLMG